MIKNPSIIVNTGTRLLQAAGKSTLTQTHAFSAKAALQDKIKSQGLSLMDKFNSAYTGRNLNKFFVPGGVDRAAEALADSKKTLILTGFNVDRKENGTPLAETDGPPGAGVLAISAARAGQIVTIITDKVNKPIVEAALTALDKKWSDGKISVESFEAKRGEDARQKAQQVLNRLKPNAVVALELPADSAGGEPKNMRGLKIGEFNQPLDQVLVAANQNKDIVTIGIGDGGNEAGMGGLPGLPQKALDGSDFASTVASQIPVTAFASNNAGLAIGAKLLANAGLKDSLVKPEEYGAAIKAAMNAGAVDGVTRLDKPNAPSADNKTMSGVDGFSVEANERFLNMINFIALREAIPALYAEKIEEGPFLVGLFDSSHGGLIAANTMIEELQNKFHGKVRLLPILDHGNAPYGDKDRDTLIKLVVDGLDVADQSKYDSVVMACNTACLAFMANPKDTKGIDLSKLKMPVHDLIANTAPHVAKNGGEYPVVLSTRATAEDPTYENRIREAAKSEKKNLKEIIRIGCGEENEKGKDWATLINHLKHESKDPADQELVRTQINKYVDQIPKHATSINLCCTHYPAIINQIKARLEETGKGHIPIFNPISVQVDALIDQLKNTNVDRRDRIDDTSPIIVTTGTPDQVTPAAVQTLLGQAASVLYSQFGDQFKLDLIAPLIRKRSEKDANSPANGHKKSNSTDSVD